MSLDIQQIRKVYHSLLRQWILRSNNYVCDICQLNMQHDNHSVALEATYVMWKQISLARTQTNLHYVNAMISA